METSPEKVISDENWNENKKLSKTFKCVCAVGLVGTYLVLKLLFVWHQAANISCKFRSKRNEKLIKPGYLGLRISAATWKVLYVVYLAKHMFATVRVVAKFCWMCHREIQCPYTRYLIVFPILTQLWHRIYRFIPTQHGLILLPLSVVLIGIDDQHLINAK